MKITFVHFGRENLGIEYLASYLKLHGHAVSFVYDPGIFSLEDHVLYIPFLENVFSRRKNTVKDVIAGKPDLVAFSVYTTTYQWALETAKRIKELSDAPVVFGGFHPTLVPEDVIGNAQVDYLIRGEGEESLLELADALQAGRPTNNIMNVWSKYNGRVISNNIRQPIRNLDNMPFPDKGLFHDDIRIADDYIIMTSRGCMYNCSYCCESFFNRIYDNKYFRRRSIPSILDELRHAKETYNIRRVMFFDGIFTYDKDWLLTFLKEYSKSISLPFRCMTHVSAFDINIANALKDAQCYCVEFGIQTFNETIRREVLQRFETNQQIQRAFDSCERTGLAYDIDIMFGIPGTEEKDYAVILDFVGKRKYLNRIKCFWLSYYPKLSILSKAREYNCFGPQEVKMITNGTLSNWYHVDSIKDKKHKKSKEIYSRLFKILPLMPLSMRGRVIRWRLYKALYFIPMFIIVILQLMSGLKNRDYRYKVYLNNYLYQIRKKSKELIRLKTS